LFFQFPYGSFSFFFFLTHMDLSVKLHCAVEAVMSKMALLKAQKHQGPFVPIRRTRWTGHVAYKVAIAYQ
jgi:hypothetical protein